MKKQLAIGVLWLSSAKIIANALGILSTLILARILAPEDFGLVAFGTTLLAVITSITELSMASALIHHQNPTEEHYSTAWTMNVLRALLIGGTVCALSGWIAHQYGDERLRPILVILGLGLIVNGFGNPKVVQLTKALVFWQEFAITVAQKLAGFIAGISVALIYHSYWALVAAAVVSQAANIAVSYAVNPFRPRFTLRHVRDLWSFSIWLTLGQVINTLNWRLDHLLVGTNLGNKALGFYTVGDNLSTTPTREMIGPLEVTLFPGFTRIGQDKQRLRQAYIKAQTLIASVALPVGAGLALVSHSLVLLFLGEKWLPAVVVMQIMAGSVAMQTLSSAVHPLALAQGKTKLLFKRDLISFAIRVPLIVFGLWYAGLIGILAGRAISTAVSIYMNMTIVNKIIGISAWQQLKANTRPLLGLAVMVLAVMAVESVLSIGDDKISQTLHLVLFVLTGATVYILTQYLLWLREDKPAGPEEEVMKMLSTLKAKLPF